MISQKSIEDLDEMWGEVEEVMDNAENGNDEQNEEEENEEDDE